MATLTLTEGECLVFKKPPAVSVSEWALKNVIVPDGPFRGGRMRRDVNPFIFPIMDAFGRRGLKQVAVCGSAQSGKTLMLYSCLGFAAAFMHDPKMLTMPDEGTLASVVGEKLLPFFQNTPLLKRLTSKVRADSLRLKDGSSLLFRSAVAKAQRASISVRVLGMDEETLYPASSLSQGDAVAEFLERVTSYQEDAKVVRISKPIGGESNTIWQAIVNSSCTLAYALKCPACACQQFARPAGLVIVDELGNEDQNPEDPNLVKDRKLGRYRCEGCGALWDDLMRDQAVAKGNWQSVKLKLVGQDIVIELQTAPENPDSLGFWLPGVLSQAISLSEVAAQMLACGRSDSPEDMQTYINGKWALPYAAITVQPLKKQILARIDNFLPARTVPHGAYALTCGIDAQKHGFYYMVLAWMWNRQKKIPTSKYIIDYGRLLSFEDLLAFLLEVNYVELDPKGQPLEKLHGIWRAAIDTGGGESAEGGDYSRTQEIYEFVRGFSNQGPLWAIKGASRELDKAVRWRVLDRMPGTGKPIPNGLTLYHLDTGRLKSALFTSLLDEDSPRPIKIFGAPDMENDDPPDHTELIRHLTAERQIITPKGKRVWKKIHNDNHFLDCLVYALACGDVNWTPSLHHYLLSESVEDIGDSHE